ncbi:DUF647 domain-containing protein [Drepanopeziza brunnea f. sp. 'multigermtubi' MB_m1]|uniref:DUF647 domain-containing protein n=1 Tax=Marssonina brunnea f. sp. multigermtubi (strain MB_m1) TaxID=1072389 RepID=K1XMY2_MARBU|nr:DUF647 domain-containing protein [Drepanopeziza brunnea f. sp. 'multigermtubi' MB_m1]EKD13834.1 DUF647 domain-containing protein [Drepanopeziza brunnea f. sp. 'multigermtubi' MB_m1]
MAQKPLSESMVEIEEVDQAKNLVATYIKSSTGDKGERIDVVIPKNVNGYARSVLDAFLPAGYPNSVTEDYLEYQIYVRAANKPWTQSELISEGLSTSVLKLHSWDAVLESRIGVGDSHASPTAALLLSVLQQSMGRIATIVFAHRLGTALEPECKMYRLAADIFNDAAMILDCLSPALPKASRVALLSLSSVLRSMCGVTAGSSKASLSAHFATQGNLGELNAKDSSQETVISLLGMLAGSVVVSYITSKTITWIALILLLATHLGTNYLAVRAVCMQTLNRQRANLVLSNILQQLSDLDDRNRRPAPRTGVVGPPALPDGITCLTPEEVQLKERVFERDGVLRWNGQQVLGYCRLGVKLQDVLDCLSRSNEVTGSTSSPTSRLRELLDIFQEEQYLIWYDEQRKTFLVVLDDESNAVAQLAAWMFALSFAKERMGMEKTETQKTGMEKDFMDALRKERSYMARVQVGIFEMLGSKWDLETGALETKSGVRIRRPKALRGY